MRTKEGGRKKERIKPIEKLMNRLNSITYTLPIFHVGSSEISELYC